MSGRALFDGIAEQMDRLRAVSVNPGDAVLLRADYSPPTVAMLLALIECESIVVPLAPATAERSPELIDIADPTWIVDIDGDGHVTMSRRKAGERNDLYKTLAERGNPGLVLFTSGSTGKPKAVVHDFSRLLAKFAKPRPPMVLLNFLMFDHWGGLNTLLHGLATGSLIVLPENRNPEYICALVERHGIELLPVTPTFLNLLLISRAHETRDMRSLKVISYGAEPMPIPTLEGLRRMFPNVELRQTYGMIELGVLRAKSKSSDSLSGGANPTNRIRTESLVRGLESDLVV